MELHAGARMTLGSSVNKHNDFGCSTRATAGAVAGFSGAEPEKSLVVLPCCAAARPAICSRDFKDGLLAPRSNDPREGLPGRLRDLFESARRGHRMDEVVGQHDHRRLSAHANRNGGNIA
jgi:hypothetical protein